MPGLDAASMVANNAKLPAMNKPVAATPVAFVKAIVLAYEKAGIDPAGALREAQITPSLLRQAEAHITSAQMEAISGHAMRELDDEALGWFSRRLPWGTYGMLCRASLSAPNLGVALTRWCRHHRLLTLDELRLTLVHDGGVARIVADEGRNFGPLREFCLVTHLRSLHGFACWAVDSRIPLLETNFPHPAPAHRSAYGLMFPGGPVRFAQPRASIAFDAQYLALPLRRDERALRAMLQRALPLTVLQYRRDRLLAQRVRELLRDDAVRLGTADTLAAALHMSSRTLHRQLHEEGASLQAFKDEVRRNQAVDLLCRSTRPLKQVALAVGFRSEKSFARAFRQWTGSSPGAYRRQAT
jgi:AraC-like DNA-binding protein